MVSGTSAAFLPVIMVGLCWLSCWTRNDCYSGSLYIGPVHPCNGSGHEDNNMFIKMLSLSGVDLVNVGSRAHPRRTAGHAEHVVQELPGSLAVASAALYYIRNK